MSNDHSLRYPKGEYERPTSYSNLEIMQWIEDIKTFPRRLADMLEEANDDDLDRTYRDGGWTLRQVVHHCCDSHMNAMLRMKWALTEDTPAIKGYFEAKWAELPDTKDAPIGMALQMLYGMHSRWVYLLQALEKEDLDKSFYHPEHDRNFTIKETIALYAWHGNHHLGHAKLVMEADSIWDEDEDDDDLGFADFDFS